MNSQLFKARVVAESQGDVRTAQSAQQSSAVRKQLVLAMMFGLLIPVLYFYDLIPNVFSTKYLLFATVCVCGSVAFLKPRPGLMRAAAVIVSCALSLVVTDLTLRATIARQLFGPPELFMYYWPPMPALWRYSPNVSFHGVISGDLASLAGPQYRHPRTIDFTTDAFGFRNDPQQVEKVQDRPYDLILLGDSFGTGVDTTQDKTWASLFEHDYRLRTYNLSAPGSGPWHELMNLKIACERLHCGNQTTVLWALFSGNDLDDDYGDALEPSLNSGRLHELIMSAKTFRNWSPIRNLVLRARLMIHDPAAPQVIIRQLPDGDKLLFRRIYTESTARTYEQVRQHPHYPKLLNVMTEMKKFADSEGVKVYVVMIPAKEEVYRWALDGVAPPSETYASGFSHAVQEECERLGFPFLDMKSSLVAAANKEFAQSSSLLWWPDDTHWNDVGHRYAASIGYQFISAPHSMAKLR